VFPSEGGSTIDTFFQDYPPVTRDQVIQFLELAKEPEDVERVPLGRFSRC
jgi:uncharacterized protein (DUF433 family)